MFKKPLIPEVTPHTLKLKTGSNAKIPMLISIIIIKLFNTHKK